MSSHSERATVASICGESKIETRNRFSVPSYREIEDRLQVRAESFTSPRRRFSPMIITHMNECREHFLFVEENR